MPFSRLRHVSFGICIVIVFVFASTLFAQTPLPPVETPEVTYSFDEAPTLDFDGAVESISADTLQVNGLLLALEAPPTIPLIPGNVVQIRASLLPNGVIEVQSIVPIAAQTLPGIIMLNGVITAINPNDRVLILSGIQIDYANAVVNDDLQVRSPVRAFVVMTAPNTWSALAVIHLDNPFDLAQPALVIPTLTPETGAQPPISTPEADDDQDDDDGEGRGRGRGRGGDDDDEQDDDDDSDESG